MSNTKNFRSAKQARQFLTEMGMSHNPACRSDHEGWHYGDGTDALLDHSATITKIGHAKYAVSLFDRKTSDDMTLSQIADVVEGGGEQADHDSSIAKPAKTKETKVNRHWNDDGSLTIYVGGVKVRRLGGEENEDASEEEIEDPEAAAEKFLGRKFPKKTGGWVWGRTTQGHNWYTKRQKMLRARLADAETAGDKKAAEALREELAKLAK